MKLSKYTRLGLLVVCCLAMLIWGVNYLKGVNIFNSSTTYYAKYDKVNGLVKSSTIIYNGFQIGLVQDVSFDQHAGDFVVELSIEGDFKLPIGSEAIIASSDLLGTKAIKIQLNEGNQYYNDGDTLPSSIEVELIDDVSNQIIPIKDKLEDLLSSLDTTLTAVNTVLNKDTQEKLSQGIAHASESMANLAVITSELNQVLQSQGDGISNIIHNIDIISGELSKSSGDFSQVAANLAIMTDSLSEANIKATINSLSNIMAKIDNGEGSVGMLLNDENIYKNIDNVTKNLNDLLVEFKANPSKYVNLTAVDFGKDIYVTSADIGSSSKYTFKIKLIESSSAIDLNNPMFNGIDVDETVVKSAYIYTTENTNNISELYPIFEQLQSSFPNAEIIAYKGDKEIKLNKALKKLSK